MNAPRSIGTAGPARTAPVPAPLMPDRYRILRHVASGGMASVWCAEDVLLGRQVAIKLLATRFARDETAASRFEREARAAARVSSHPHVVTIFDIGDGGGSADGPEQPFIVMQYMAGGTVADQLRRGGIRRQEALRWLREAASAIDHGHALGVIHRDIKPGNLLLDISRVLHVADFGIARLANEDTITSTGELVGTAAYLSPEQVQGAPATAASDRYALGLVAFELLTGELPFPGEHLAAQARQHVEATRPRASERSRAVPRHADGVFMRAMAQDPAERYETSAAFVDELELALGGRPLVPAPPPARRPAPLPAGRPAPRAPGRPAPRALPWPAPRTLRRPIPAQRPAPRPPAGRPTARRGVAAAALVSVVIVVVALAMEGAGKPPAPRASIAAHGTGASDTRGATSSRRRSHPIGARAQPAATSSTPAATTAPAGSRGPAAPGPGTAAPAPGAGGPPDATQLQLSGHEQLLAGRYQDAIATLRRAIASAPPDSLVYAYALYDLGRSLVLAGEPAAAVPVLERRLQIPNQTGVVRQLLLVALRASGQLAPGDHGRGHGRGHDGGPPHPNGGAGVSPFLIAPAAS